MARSGYDQIKPIFSDLLMNYINHMNYAMTITNEYGDQIRYYSHPIFKTYCSNSNGDIQALTAPGLYKPVKQSCINGYLMFRIGRIGYRSHRFVYECMNNRLLNDQVEIDHIDRNRMNNKITNLREVNRSTNRLNRFSNREVIHIPEDAIRIVQYDGHRFEDLFYSPYTGYCYMSSEGCLFELPFKSRGRITVGGVRIYRNKLLKLLGLEDSYVDLLQFLD